MSELDRTREFKRAMSQLTSAVNIISTDGPAGKLGLTVSAVCRGSDDPATVIVCINRSSRARDIFVENGRLAVNVLTGNQELLAMHFAGQTGVEMAERFAWDVWSDLDGLPTLRDARVAVAGTIIDRVEHGTHTVLFVAVDELRTRSGRGGLVYDSRSFHQVGSGAY
ncbi:flavin reductase [Gulosibacter faecalis]|uniref:Flavin reductase n=1 Tax=Gulosibacter faecalis TaxID=272240 RepID=A0ABW5UX93_9MICO|nr:flavin reductase [Gulosibacter faecalis]